MKITRKQLRRIIRESLNETPRMSGIMSPEDPSVMADIERRRNQGDEERVAEIYGQEISDLAMLIHYYEGDLSDEEILVALAEDPRFDIDSIEPDEMAIIWDLAVLDAEEL